MIGRFPRGGCHGRAPQTADHLVDCLLFYAVHLARRADREVSQVRDGPYDEPPRNLLGACTGAAAILAGVCTSADATVRAYHPAGMADAEGFAAMGCDEILMHTFDIAAGIGVESTPPPGIAELAGRVVRRLFPWAPAGAEPWPALLWANGRGDLPGVDRLGADWSWLCAPLTDWDGTRRIWRGRSAESTG